MGRTLQLGKETVIYGGAGILAKSVRILLVPIYARVLTIEEYGVVALVGSVITLCTALASMNLSNSAHRWYYDNDDLVDRKTTISSWAWCWLGIALAAAAILFLASGAIADYMLPGRQLDVYLRWASATVPLTVLGGVIWGWLRVQRRALATGIYKIVQSALGMLLVILAVVGLRRGVLGIYQAQVVNGIVFSLIAILLLRDWINPRYIDLRRLRVMFAYSLPLVPATLATWFTVSGNRWILQWLADVRAVSLFSMAAAAASVFGMAVGAFQMAWGPFAFSILREPSSRRVYARTFELACWGGCATATAFCLWAPELLTLFATSKYTEAQWAIAPLCFSLLSGAILAVVAIGTQLARDTKPIAIAIFLNAMISLAANLLLVPYLGADGAAWAALIGSVLGTVYVYRGSQKRYPIPYRAWITLPCAGLSAIIVMGILAIPSGVPAGVVWPLKLVLPLAFLPLGAKLGIYTFPQAVAHCRSAGNYVRQAISSVRSPQ